MRRIFIYREPEAIIKEGIRRLRAFFAALGLPATLSDMGIGEDKLEFMAKKATRAEYGKESAIGAIRPLLWQDVLNIYRMAK